MGSSKFSSNSYGSNCSSSSDCMATQTAEQLPPVRLIVAREVQKKGLTSSKYAFALAVLIRILCSDFSLAGGVGQGEDQGLLNMLAHLLYHLLNIQ